MIFESIEKRVLRLVLLKCELTITTPAQTALRTTKEKLRSGPKKSKGFFFFCGGGVLRLNSYPMCKHLTTNEIILDAG